MIDFYILTLQISMLVVGALIMLFSIDDLLVDGWFWTREIYRGLVIRPRYKPLPESALHERAQQPLAIMIPSWQEDAVIGAMIENTVQVLDYENYRIFVGTYPNDAATIAEVERARRRHKRVVRVQTPHSGPTSKADCLNHILAAIRQEELDTGREYAGVVMHDCEDVLHPLELKFFNYLLPRKDMIQLPVVALERGLSELIAGTYMDEFAEWHAKDLVVRESFAGTVPSAGVGTCFSHKAIVELRNGKGQPFNTKTLTEDYDVGERLAAKGLRAIIARYDVDYRVRGQGRDADADAEGYVTVRMPLCVREYFPNTFHTARRQKARWMIGIALQGWTQLGWTKSFRTNYFLARDRKALLSAPLVVADLFTGLAGRCGLGVRLQHRGADVAHRSTHVFREPDLWVAPGPGLCAAHGGRHPGQLRGNASRSSHLRRVSDHPQTHRLGQDHSSVSKRRGSGP